MRTHLFEDMIHSIDVDHVPLEFIIMAKVTSMDGSERLIRGPELAEVIRGPNRLRLMSFNVILDVRKIRTAVVAAVNEVYDAINKLLAEKSADI